jgi:uncharacterized protein
MTDTFSDDNAVIDLSGSAAARMKPVPLSAVQIEDTFWRPRLDANRDITIPSQLEHCEKTGRIDNFRRAAGKIEGAFQGIFFNDSDVYKWLEAAAFSLATHPDPKLDADVDAVIQEIADAQQPDGYLNTYFMFEKAGERYTNLKDMHELYCAGHLIQAAVAHFRATGKRSLLDVAVKLADHLDSVFGAEAEGKRSGTCGHEELEMALVELARTTGENRYLRLAKFMIEARGQTPGIFGNSVYHQDHLPFVEQTEMVGHAVRHLYLCCGAADVALETGDAEYRTALNALWENFTQKRMYVTGGAGARYEGEAFGADYELPNDRAYTETCAAIGSVMWNWRMLHLTGDAQFADLMERTLYNAVLPGLSLDGRHYFYQNPLADRGKHRRQEWFGCACCPPNVARLLASLPGYFCSMDGQGAFLHLYAAGTLAIPFENGEILRLKVETDFPWNGVVRIGVKDVPKTAKSLSLRIPAWTEGATLVVNGRPFEASLTPGTYRRISTLQAGDVLELNLPMPIRLLESNPHVLGNLGRVAVMRGPLIYCLEQADNDGADVWDIYLPENVELAASEQPDLLGGVTVLTGQGLALQHNSTELLYSDYQPRAERKFQPVEVCAIPYYAWANREPGAIQVWLPLAQ